jgi:hypothetical protein
MQINVLIRANLYPTLGTVPIKTQPQNVHHNPLILWIIFALLIRALFANDITALILSRRIIKFDYFAQLEQHPTVQILVVTRSLSHINLNQLHPNLAGKQVEIEYKEYRTKWSTKMRARLAIYEKWPLVSMCWSLTGQVQKCCSHTTEP